MKAKPQHHREAPWRRNRDDNVVDVPSSVIEAPSMALVPYQPPMAPAIARPRPRPSAARAAAARVARAAAEKAKAQLDPDRFSAKQLGQGAALAAGFAIPTWAAYETGHLGSWPIGVSELVAGGAGAAFLGSYFKPASVGVFSAGLAQIVAAGAAARARNKANKELARKRELEAAIVAMAVQQGQPPLALPAPKPAPTPPPTEPPRNAYARFDLAPAYAAVDQAQAEVGQPVERNGWDWPAMAPTDDDTRNAWAWQPPDPYAAADPFAYAAA